MSIFSQRSSSASRGFTLIELLTVVSVMLVLTSIFLLRQQKFDSSTILRSLGYSVGLSIRQAQVYGTSIRESATGAFQSGTAARAYGVYFDSANAAASPSTYKIFADLNNNGQYDASPTDETVQIFKILKGYSISKFCATTTGGTLKCWSSTSPTLSNMTIMFKRPNPDACVATSVAANACQTGASPAESYSNAYVQLKSGIDTRGVTTTITGQISIGGSGS